MTCPCSSHKPYDECCKPFHKGKKPLTALELMRSRFSAYALGFASYLIKTTHPANPQYSEDKESWKKKIERFSKSCTFNRLEILDVQENSPLATVSFTAHITQNGEDSSFTETSFFDQSRGTWLYLGGKLTDGSAPNFATSAQLKLLPLAYYGDPILRRKAQPIEHITEDLKSLVEAMIETMDACNGMGLAAPQVHHSIRLFVIRSPQEEEGSKNYSLGEVKVFINPKILTASSEKWKAPEGCLSIPTIHADVERPQEIVVEYTDLEGHLKKESFRGWEAKVILHENDHIEGVLFIDRLPKKERLRLEPFLKKVQKRIHDGLEM